MKKYIPYIIIIVLTVALLLSVQRCHRVESVSLKNMQAWNDTLTTFKNRVGTITASMKTLQVDKSTLKSMVLERDKKLLAYANEFAEVHTVVQTNTVTKIDTVFVVYTEPVPYGFERSGSVNDDWYSFDYASDENGLRLSNLAIPDTVTMITGVKRKWFLGKETLTTDVTHVNPHVTVTGIKAVEVVLPTPWYKKWYVWLAAGAIGGAFIVK